MIKGSKQMNTSVWYAAAALLMSTATTILGQSEISKFSSSNSSYIQTSKLVGRKIKSSEGKNIGVLKDVVIDSSNGCMAYTVVSTGGEGTGVTSGGGKIIALPWAVYSPTSDLSVLTVNVSPDKIFNAPPFDYGRMDEYARPDYINNVYSYYGVTAGPPQAVAASGRSEAGTDATGTAGATASPGEVASPGPIATVPQDKGPSVHSQPASAATPDGESTEHSRTKTRTASAIGSPSTSRREAGSPNTIEEPSSSETTSIPAENKSRRKIFEKTSPRTPRATPTASDLED